MGWLAVTEALARQPAKLVVLGHGGVRSELAAALAPRRRYVVALLQGGMQPVANAKSDAKGEFTFDNPGLGAQPMLVRAVYHGVNFHQPVPPGSGSVQVNIFE